MAININDINSLLGNQTLTQGMTEEQKQQAVNFTKEEPNLLQKAGTEFGKGVGRAAKASESLLAPKQATTKTAKKTRDVGDVKPVRDDYVTKLEPKEQKMVRNTVTETQGEIKQAAEDPSIFAQAAEQLGIAGDYAASLFENFDNPIDRVDWLTMATIYAASRSQGNNATMAIANGLLRGMESKGKQEQAKAMMEANALQAQQGQANKDRQFMLDKYDAQSRRMNAEAATQRASESGKDLLGALDPDQRKVADAAAESFGGDSALAYEAANQILKGGGQLSTMAVKQVMQQMQEKGYATDPLIGKSSLM